MRSSWQFQTTLCFITKRFWAQNSTSPANSNKHNKDKWIETSKGNNFLLAQKLLDGKSWFLRSGDFLRSKSFRKKKNQTNKLAWNCHDNLIYFTTEKLLSEKLCYLRDPTSSHWSLCFLHHHVTYRTMSLMVIYRECYGFERAFIYLTLLPAGFKASLEARSSTSKFAGLHAYPQNIAPAWLFVWVTAIHKRGIVVGSI